MAFRYSPRKKGLKDGPKKKCFNHAKEKGFDISSVNAIIPNYNGLYDPNLRDHWNNKRTQKHLRRVGLIDTKGRPVEENHIPKFFGVPKQQLGSPMIDTNQMYVLPQGSLDMKFPVLLGESSQLSARSQKGAGKKDKASPPPKPAPESPCMMDVDVDLPSRIFVFAGTCHTQALLDKLVAESPEKFVFTVSHTTRDPREGEELGETFHFTDKEQMIGSIEDGKFLEHSEIEGELYGTSSVAIEAALSEGKICLLKMDVQGIAQLKLANLTAKYIFVNPPMEVVEKNLREDDALSEEQIQEKLENTRVEVERADEPGFFDFVLLDAEFDESFVRLKEYIATATGSGFQEEEESQNQESPHLSAKFSEALVTEDVTHEDNVTQNEMSQRPSDVTASARTVEIKNAATEENKDEDNPGESSESQAAESSVAAEEKSEKVEKPSLQTGGVEDAAEEADNTESSRTEVSKASTKRSDKASLEVPLVDRDGLATEQAGEHLLGIGKLGKQQAVQDLLQTNKLYDAKANEALLQLGNAPASIHAAASPGSKGETTGPHTAEDPTSEAPSANASAKESCASPTVRDTAAHTASDTPARTANAKSDHGATEEGSDQDDFEDDFEDADEDGEDDNSAKEEEKAEEEETEEA